MPSKSVILKTFTKEVILNSVPGLKQRIKAKFEKEARVKEISSLEGFEASLIHGPAAPAGMPPEFMPLPGAQIPASLRFPARPQMPGGEVAGIRFGKLSPVIQNPSINVIECPGPGREIIIRTYNIRKPYPIVLSKEEMQKLVEQFAEKAKVPIISGLMRAWIDKFMISATIVNDQVENFILQKVIYPHFA
jgi:hypothetical protein